MKAHKAGILAASLAALTFGFTGCHSTGSNSDVPAPNRDDTGAVSSAPGLSNGGAQSGTGVGSAPADAQPVPGSNYGQPRNDTMSNPNNNSSTTNTGTTSSP